MTQLVPCGGCARHVRAEEGPCPFCGAAISSPPPATALRGATRAAIFYLGATLAACGGQSQPEPEPTIMQPYGAPPNPEPPEPPPDPIEPESVAAPYGAAPTPPEPPPESDPTEPRAIVPPYGAPALPDSAY